MTPSDYEKEKEQAAKAAVALVEEGMAVGLGTGSTATYAIKALGARVAAGLTMVGVPTSERSRVLAEELGIPLATLDDQPRLDITIDGADRFNDGLELIKGGGGALLREKIVAAATRRLVIIVDSRKRSNPLGGFRLPVEIIPFGLKSLMERLTEEGLSPIWRIKGDPPEPFVTDEGNYIIDLDLEEIENPKDLGRRLDRMPGVVEHGLFLGMTSEVLMGLVDEVIRFDGGKTQPKWPRREQGARD